MKLLAPSVEESAAAIAAYGQPLAVLGHYRFFCCTFHTIGCVQ
jgi:hypothetical protein